MGSIFTRKKKPSPRDLARMQDELNKRWQAELKSKEVLEIIEHYEGTNSSKGPKKRTKGVR